MSESQRARYLRGDLTHDEYWGLLVEALGEQALRQLLPHVRSGRPREPEEWRQHLDEDKHLNNVPLGAWDRMHPYVRGLVQRCPEEERRAITGSLAWSLSDTVCVLKCTARRYAETVG